MSKKSEHNDENEARELYEHRQDPGEWEQEPERIEVRPARSSVLSVRLPRAEFDALEEAARAAEETLSEYVRRAVMQRIQGTGMPASATVVSHSVAILGYPFEVTNLQAWSSSGGMAELRTEHQMPAGR